MSETGKKFYDLTIEQRLDRLAALTGLDGTDLAVFKGADALSSDQADYMIENVVGTFQLPLGVAQGFLINGHEIPVPMAIEEPSVVAGVSYMARLVRSGGGFKTISDPPEMIGQIQILDLKDPQKAWESLLAHKKELLMEAGLGDPLLLKLGGGPRDLEVRLLEHPAVGNFLVLHLIMDVRDAMGANVVNTAVERLAPLVAKITGGRVHLRILSNLADRRLTKSSCIIKLNQLAFNDFSAENVRDGIIAAWAFATVDPYRAATHNKGIMNGVDAVVIATGNDWRAVEAGAHAYAARDGRYTSLSTWCVNAAGDLAGTLEMPMAVGIVGGATQAHPMARVCLKLMGVTTSADLAGIIVSVGLAQNLAALRALATEGIQRGHMSLHARQVAITAGAKGPDIDRLADQLINEKTVRIDRAEAIMKQWSESK
ncbi:MAG: hydroxymethylglutaryl-CoA reductase, degradative [Anaerolineaceae bacterium]|nr:hydroxymethylglutaryl-CoA reductase, degradative [Anaerolineaceae bacterium]MBN2677360.1 hydroxymethylglutaryl-CoA reductase, degradative [Anaerolineaceae bacterium]